jgi:hypothetical protein
MKFVKKKSHRVSGVSESQFETHLNGWVSLEASKFLGAFCQAILRVLLMFLSLPVFLFLFFLISLMHDAHTPCIQ